MDSIVALAAAAIVLFLLIVALSLFKKQFNQSEPKNEAAAAPDHGEVIRPVRRAVVARNVRGRIRAVQRHHSDDENEQDVMEAEEEPQNEEEKTFDVGDGKVGKKKLAKLEAKAERKAAREAEEREREEKKKKEMELMEEKRKKEEEEEMLEKQREEQAKKEQEERERREQEEYLKMKAAFSVEEEGFDAEEKDNQDDLFQQFIEHIKSSKIVLLEELAARFQLKTQEAINRINQLTQDGVLTGVIDDRGKFIYISREEMEAVAKFIRQRGRVSLTDLAESSNQLIQLTSASNQPVTAS
nr:EOG090X0N9E [Cyclestheria hislopi]